MIGIAEKVEFHNRYEADNFFHEKIREGAKKVKFWALSGKFFVEFEA